MSPTKRVIGPATVSELRVTVGRLGRRLRAQDSRPLGHGSVLVRLELEGPKTTSELAASEHVRPQSMAQTVGELEGEGLVARRPDPLDRRRVLLEITERGREVLVDDRRRRDDWLTRAIETLAPEEQELIERVLPVFKRLVQVDGGAGR